MRIHLISDLHFEANGEYEIPVIKGKNSVNLVCGDITENHSETENILNDLKKQHSNLYYVMGNHDYYGSDLVRGNPSHNSCVFLNDNTILILTTLWTDYNNYNKKTIKWCYETFDDFNKIYYDGLKVTPYKLAEEHENAKNFIHSISASYPEHRIIVASHHAPSLKSTPECPNEDEKYYYASDMDDFILEHKNIILWCHGHTHISNDYMIGQCRVVSNPFGFEGNTNWHHIDNSEKFDPDFLIEVS